MQGAQPGDHLLLPDPPRVLERARRAHGDELVVALQPGPRGGRRRAGLHELDDECDVHGALDGGPARLALALAVVPVADREDRARLVHRQVAGDAGAHLRGVHVPAERVGGQRGADLPVGRRDADRAEHRRDRQVDREVAALGDERDGAARPVELVDPGQLGQRVVQQRRPVGPGQAAEERHEGGGAPVARGREVDQVEHQGVAGFGAAHRERAGLRVEEARVEGPGRHVGDRADLPAEGVVAPQAQHVPRVDLADRGDAAEGPRVLVGGRGELDVHGGPPVSVRVSSGRRP